jgi:ribosome maturation factor RimP
MATDQDPQQERLASVRTIIEPVLRAHAVELADVAWATEHGALTLRVTIERPLPEGTPWRPELGFGVNLDDCATVSRDVSSALDAIDDTMPEAYALEVSSPGLDRPLHGARDFVRFAGNAVKVKLKKPAADGQRLLRGTLIDATEDTIAVLVDGKRLEAAVTDVAEAQLVFELTKGEKTGPKPAKTSARGQKPAAKAKRASGSRAG